MADITITAANVVPDAGFTFRDCISGATLTAGMAVYLDPADSNKAKGAITTNATTANVLGIALHAALAGQPVRVMTGGTITIGGTTAVGIPYLTSDNAGGLAVLADNGAGDYVTFIGIGTSTTKIRLGITPSGAAHA